MQRKKTLLYYSCQLEIDHVTQPKKETCQSTCNGPNTLARYSVRWKLVFQLWILISKINTQTQKIAAVKIN